MAPNPEAAFSLLAILVSICYFCFRLYSSYSAALCGKRVNFMNGKPARANQMNNQMNGRYRAPLSVLCVMALALTLAWIGGCSKKPVAEPAPPPAAPSSAVRVSSGADSISIETATAEFTIAPDGY